MRTRNRLVLAPGLAAAVAAGGLVAAGRLPAGADERKAAEK